MMPENDKESISPSWRQKLDNISQQKGLKDIAYEIDKDYLIKEEEIALKHPTLDSIVKLTDDGYIDIFAGPSLGIRLDPKTNSINFFGDNINMLTKQFNIMTKGNGLCWNGYYFNPELYMESTTERTQMLTGTKQYYHLTHESQVKDRKLAWHTDAWQVQPMIRTDNKRRYSEGMTQLLNDLGLTVE